MSIQKIIINSQNILKTLKINIMIKKYNEFLNEKISNKLFGKNEEEIMDFLKSIDDPQTILDKAIRLKFIDGINYALEQGADINSHFITTAIEDGEIEIAKNLISHTDNILIKNKVFEEILKTKNSELLQFLFDSGFKIDFLNIKFIERLVLTNKITMMKIILNSDIDLNKYSIKIFANALLYSHINMIKLLLKYNINVNPDSNIFNPIEYACYDDKKFKLIIELLIENGLNKENYINEALKFWILRGKIEQVKYLVEIGADIHTFNRESDIFVNKSKMIELVKYLKEKNPE